MHDSELFFFGDATVSQNSVHGRLRVEAGRLRNDAGFVQWRGISEFDLIHLVRTGQEAEALRRISRGANSGRRNVFRVFCRAVNLFDLNHRQPGYWEAADRVLQLVSNAGAYAEFVAFCDAQSMADGERHAFLAALCERYKANPAFILQIANEPFKNGWSGATDPDLLQLADLAAGILGHRDFSIGDPQDGDDPDASAQTMKEAISLAKHSNIIPLHSSRQGDAQTSGERFRRWIDHLEGFYDIIGECHKVNPNAWGCHDEPMGFADAPFVAGHARETDPEAALAGELTAQMIGCGFTYHYIAPQNDGTPGLNLIGELTPTLTPDPSWSYRNDSWGGSATNHFAGWGKVRTWTNGHEAVVLASGANKGSITWANGFAPDKVLYDGDHVTVYHATK